MPYADIAAVKVRAGRLAEAWTDESTPGETDILVHLETYAGEIDALLGKSGATLPLAVTDPAALALKGLNADGALVLMIDATWPGLGSSEGVKEIRAQAIARRDAAWAAMMDGTHPAVVYIDSLPGSPGATDFWTEEPQYPTPGEAAAINPPHAPMFARGSKL